MGSSEDPLRAQPFRTQTAVPGSPSLEARQSFQARIDEQARLLTRDRRLAAQLAAPTWKLRGNAILIESKEDIRRRLGTSTDDADAVILAWHKRDEALRRQTKRKLEPGRAMGPGWMGV